MKLMKKLGIISAMVCVFGISFATTSMAEKIAPEEFKTIINDKNKEGVNYYKNNSVTTLAKEIKTITIETIEEDKTLLEQKTKEFEEKMKAEQITFIEKGLKEAKTLEEVEKVKSDAAKLLKKEKEKFKEESTSYIQEKIKTETKDVVMISASYQLIRDNLFIFNKHEFYYYDINKKELIPNEKLMGVKEVETFEEQYKAHTKTKESPMNTVYMLGLLTIMCVYPVIRGKGKAHLARTS